MAATRTTPIHARKRPKQQRATQLIEAVLEAAVQVLMAEGAQRFTTARVAERAGVSVGSLYQYFPNKAAILFRLQADEWRRTTSLLSGILEQRDVPPAARLRRLVHAFVRSECEEAAIRLALADAAPLYRDAPEAVAAKGEAARVYRAFVEEALPDAPEADRHLAGDLIKMTLSQVGASFSATPRDEAEIVAWSEAIADMFLAYLSALRAKTG
ncbi:transcriptional regulator, TetR family [Sphingomonas sp. NFR04]|uniref:TetR family transcriptional regulator n=1 Tax=Sphingomonas sp. NFR04 TaxID=1566283 RepID=UPI0008E428BE|nr:TetR family transcriptional regulator [Sphingomonas sp. NFR04]SFK57597.1 transcriptional regulator, TetR family [Sphingomonas sp. NFR04]